VRGGGEVFGLEIFQIAIMAVGTLLVIG